MESQEKVRLCVICLKRKAGNLNMCVKCRDMSTLIDALIQESPRQAVEYLEKKFKQAQKKLKNRFMDRPVGK